MKTQESQDIQYFVRRIEWDRCRDRHLTTEAEIGGMSRLVGPFAAPCVVAIENRHLPPTPSSSADKELSLELKKCLVGHLKVIL